MTQLMKFIMHYPLRSPNEIPPLTKTQYFYKTHQSATVSIPKHNHHGRIPVSPDEAETHSYVTKVDTTHLGPRKQQKRFRDDDDSEHHLKPFFRTGKFCIKCPPEKILIAKRGLGKFFIHFLTIEMSLKDH